MGGENTIPAPHSKPRSSPTVLADTALSPNCPKYDYWSRGKSLSYYFYGPGSAQNHCVTYGYITFSDFLYGKDAPRVAPSGTGVPLSAALDQPTATPYTAAVIFIEAPLFSRLLAEYLSDDEYAALQWALTQRPDAGAIIPGSGGIRKLRWAGSGRGKRGGIRVIYYWKNRAGEIWLLTLYAKNEAADIPLNVLRQLQQEIES